MSKRGNGQMIKTVDHLRALDLADVLREFAYDCKLNVDQFWCYDEFREACEKNAALATAYADALAQSEVEDGYRVVWPASVDEADVSALLRQWWETVVEYAREALRNDDEEAFASWSNDLEEIERLALYFFETAYR